VLVIRAGGGHVDALWEDATRCGGKAWRWGRDGDVAGNLGEARDLIL
jgi:hypothetical protein